MLFESKMHILPLIQVFWSFFEQLRDFTKAWSNKKNCRHSLLHGYCIYTTRFTHFTYAKKEVVCRKIVVLAMEVLSAIRLLQYGDHKQYSSHTVIRSRSYVKFIHFWSRKTKISHLSATIDKREFWQPQHNILLQNVTQPYFITTAHILRTVWTFFILTSQNHTHLSENCLDLFYSTSRKNAHS